MAGLTGGDITAIAGGCGFSDSAGEIKSVYGGRLISLRRPSSNRVLDCFLKGNEAYVSATRNIGDDIPPEAVLIDGIKAEGTEDLKNMVLPVFSSEWNNLASSKTEAVAEVKRRIGQNRYRAEQFRLWDGACALTGVDIPELLIASHAVPWSEEEEASCRLDPYNGFLFEARIDRLFDRHLISFTDDGSMLISSAVTEENRRRLGIYEGMKLRKVYTENLPYLRRHRQMMLELK